MMMDRMLREIEQINKEGVTVVLVEQRIKAAAAMAKTVSVLRLGTIVQKGRRSKQTDPKWLADAIYGSSEPMRNSA